MDINETAKRISDFIGGDYTAESIASMMNIQIDLHLQAFGSEEEFGEIIPEQLRSDLDLIRGNERDMADVLDSVDKKFLRIGMDSDYAGKYLKEAISELESYRGYANDDIKRAEVLLNTEQALEQNDNMIDGVINNEADSREIPGTYDEAEKEADEAEHERIIKDMKEDPELEKAKEFISEFTQSEYGSEPNFSDLSAVGLAYTTIDYPEFLKEAGVTDYDKEFEIQVDANLIDKEIITYIDGDELLTEKFDSLADMNEFLEVLDFNDLIHIGDAGWQKIADWEIDREAMAALDAHEAEFGADGSRVFPHLNDEPGEKTEIFVSLSGNDVSKGLMDHLLNNNYDAHYRQKGEQTVLVVDSDVITEVQTILDDRNIPHSLEPISFEQINENNDSILSEAGIKRGERLPESMVNYLNEQAVSPREPQPALDGSSQITVSISSKFVSDPFTAKDGKEYVRVKIPNEDRNDKSSWASIVIPPEQVSKNEDTGRAELTLKADGHSTLVKSEYKGHDENGKAVFEQKKSKVSNAELKKRVEHTEPKNIGNTLKANKEKAAEINKQREKSSEHNKSVNRNNGRE